MWGSANRSEIGRAHVCSSDRFYGGEENQGGSPNRGEGVPFNETVNLSRYQGNSPYVGISQSQCFNCNFMPGGFSGGYPLSPFTLNAGVSMRGVQSDFRNPRSEERRVGKECRS